jgi:SAM-dependent methyltransferase
LLPGGGRRGGSTSADYAAKLSLYDRFAEPELRRLIGGLPLAAGARVLDAGCGSGGVLAAFVRRLDAAALVVGIDLAVAHLQAARDSGARLVQADFSRLPVRDAAFDLVWMLNALHHAADPAAVLRGIIAAVAPGGRIVIAQSSFLPDMLFAWDQHFERRVYDACLRAYRDLLRLSERETGGIRRLAGLAREAGLDDVTVRTVVVERTAPLTPADRRYFHEAVFQGYWGPKLKPYLSAADWSELTALTDAASPAYALDRADFHHVQTLTVASGIRPRGTLRPA